VHAHRFKEKLETPLQRVERIQQELQEVSREVQDFKGCTSDSQINRMVSE